MKKRMKIFTLLGKIQQNDISAMVIITGRQSGRVLYEGRLLDVPFGRCDDYVQSYTHIPGRLEIVSTISQLY